MPRPIVSDLWGVRRIRILNSAPPRLTPTMVLAAQQRTATFTRAIRMQQPPTCRMIRVVWRHCSSRTPTRTCYIRPCKARLLAVHRSPRLNKISRLLYSPRIRHHLSHSIIISCTSRPAQRPQATRQRRLIRPHPPARPVPQAAVRLLSKQRPTRRKCITISNSNNSSICIRQIPTWYTRRIPI